MLHAIFGAIALALILTAVFGSVRTVLARIGEARIGVSAAFAMLILAVGPAMIGRATHNLLLAAAIATLFCLAPAIALERWRAPAPAVEEKSHRPHIWAIVIAAVGFVLVVICAFTTYLWDEGTGHFALGNSIARGVLPAVLPTFPSDLFHYHYGYDVHVGLVRAFTGAPVAVACDLVTCSHYVVLLLVIADAGFALGGRMGSSIAIVLAPFGYGVLAICLSEGWGVKLGCMEWFPADWVSAPRAPPVPISNFFQHPQGFGMSASLAAILLIDGKSAHGREDSRYALGALALSLSSLAHSLYFLTSGLGLGVALIVDFIRTRDLRRALLRASMLVAALVGAFLIGGMLSFNLTHERVFSFEHGYFNDSFVRTLIRCVSFFGLALPAIPLAFWRTWRHPSTLRVVLIVGATFGFIFANMVVYTQSWDIVKFFAIAAFFAYLLLSDLFAALLERPSRTKQITVSVLTAASVAASWFWLLRHSVLNGTVVWPYREFPPPPASVALSDAMDDEIAPYDLVLTNDPTLSSGTGFLMPGFDWRREGATHFFERALNDRLLDLRKHALTGFDKQDLDALGVKWIALTASGRNELPEQARRALDDPARFEHVCDTGQGDTLVHVYRVLGVP